MCIESIHRPKRAMEMWAGDGEEEEEGSRGEGRRGLGGRTPAAKGTVAAAPQHT
jgi:hypothetical protein